MTTAAAQPASSIGPTLTSDPRLGGIGAADLSANRSAPPPGRSTLERPPLMQSRQTSLPLSSRSSSAGALRPQIAHSDSSDGGSFKPGASVPVKVIAAIEPDVVALER